MRLVWSLQSLENLEAVAERAPRAARAIFERTTSLALHPFPGMYRRVEGKPQEHVFVIAPYIIVYRIDGEALSVLGVLDGRRERRLR